MPHPLYPLTKVTCYESGASPKGMKGAHPEKSRAGRLTVRALSVVAAHSPMRGCRQVLQGCGCYADRVQDSDVRKEAACAEGIDGCVRYDEQLGNFADRSKILRNRCFWLQRAGDSIAEARMISRYLQSAAIGCDLIPRIWEQNVGGSNPLASTELSPFRSSPARICRDSVERYPDRVLHPNVLQFADPA